MFYIYLSIYKSIRLSTYIYLGRLGHRCDVVDQQLSIYIYISIYLSIYLGRLGRRGAQRGDVVDQQLGEPAARPRGVPAQRARLPPPEPPPARQISVLQL